MLSDQLVRLLWPVCTIIILPKWDYNTWSDTVRNITFLYHSSVLPNQNCIIIIHSLSQWPKIKILHIIQYYYCINPLSLSYNLIIMTFHIGLIKSTTHSTTSALLKIALVPKNISSTTILQWMLSQPNIPTEFYNTITCNSKMNCSAYCCIVIASFINSHQDSVISSSGYDIIKWHIYYKLSSMVTI